MNSQAAFANSQQVFHDLRISGHAARLRTLLRRAGQPPSKQALVISAAEREDMLNDRPTNKAKPGAEQKGDASATEIGRLESDISTFSAIGWRNLDAALEINRLAVDCLERCWQRQADVLSKFPTDVVSLPGTFGMQANAVPARGGLPAVAETVQLMLKHIWEVSEIIARTNNDVLDVVRNRSEACFKEILGDEAKSTD